MQIGNGVKSKSCNKWVIYYVTDFAMTISNSVSIKTGHLSVPCKEQKIMIIFFTTLPSYRRTNDFP